MALYGLVEILKLHLDLGRLSVGSGRLYAGSGLWEVIWVGEFKTRWMGRIDGWVGQMGKFVRWLGSSGGSGNKLGRLVRKVRYGLVEIVKLNSKPLMKDHCRYRAARAAKNKTTKTKATNKHRQQTNKYHRQTTKQTQCNSLQYFYTLEYTHIPSHPWYHTKHATTSSLF